MKSRSPKMDNLNKGKPIKEHVGQRLLWCEGGNIYIRTAEGALHLEKGHKS